MSDTVATIPNYFARQEIKNNLNLVLSKYFPAPEEQQKVLAIFELIKKGEFSVNELTGYLIDVLEMEAEKAMEIDSELFDKVYGDVYQQLQGFYEEKQGEEVVEGEKGVAVESLGGEFSLTQRYSEFINSSLFQNILAAEGQMKEEYENLLQGGSRQSQEPTAEMALKDEFYGAINAGDKVKTIGLLRMIAGSGRMRVSFKNDKRYIDFFAGVIGRHQGEKEKENFLLNAAQKKYLVSFLKFILEKRLGFSVEEAAMIGVGLGALCREAGESEYADVAYGDENKNEFVWGE